MKIPKYLQTNNVVNIGHNSNRSISQEAYKQLKDTITRVLNSLDVADKKHRASHGDDYFFADELTNPKDVERYPGSPVEYESIVEQIHMKSRVLQEILNP